LRPSADGIYLVGTAAGPLGGDVLGLDVVVDTGVDLTMRSAAASIALPGAHGGTSTIEVTVDVGDGGELRWLPEPLIAAHGCDHRSTATIRLGHGARLVWRDEVVLGRHGEAPGSCLQRLRVDRGGRALLRSDLGVGPAWPGWDGPAGVGDAAAVATVVVVGFPVGPRPVVEGGAAAVLALDDGAVVLTAVARRPGALRAAVETWLLAGPLSDPRSVSRRAPVGGAR
jgi:urease accessory protein